MSKEKRFRGFRMTSVCIICARIMDCIDTHELITAEKIYNLEFKNLFNDDKYNRKLRAFIKKAIEFGYPIGANNFGYYVMKEKKDLDRAIERINNKIAGEHKRIDFMIRAFEKWGGGSNE